MLDPSQFRQALRFEGGMNRRLFLAYSAALSAIPSWNRAIWAEDDPRFDTNPFTLGVASGDPDTTSVVLWTRLAPAPLEPYGGMPPVAIEVAWQIAEDDAMNRVVAFGTSLATPQLGHAVHVEVAGLKPDRWHWYRFRAGDAESPLGRTRTLPELYAKPQQLKFVFTSCQHYEQGLYTAYEQMARDELDLVIHLGDYIYEDPESNGLVRKHVGGEIKSLTDYRVRLAQYRSDPLLHNMHAQCPWLVTLDDHEVDNNWAGEISEEKDIPVADFLLRRAAAFQAYYEMMPLRARSLPRGPHMRLYRNAVYGQLANLMVLDTRQYRTDQANDDRASILNDAAMDRANTLLGDEQHNWLCAKLIESPSTWNVLAQQVMMGMAGFSRDGGSLTYSMDQWSGYAHERMRMMSFLADRRIPNPIVVTGDIHSNWVNDLRVDDRVPSANIVATEFVGTSLSSGGNGTEKPRHLDQILLNNPCVKFHNGERGYVRCTVTPTIWKSDYVVVDEVTKPGGQIFDRASFVVEAGKPGVRPA